MRASYGAAGLSTVPGMSATIPRRAALVSLAALAVVATGCGSADVSYKVPRTTPPLTVPAGSPASGETPTTPTTATTTTPTTAAPAAPSAAAPAAPAAPAPAAPATGGTGAGGATPTTPAAGTGGASAQDFNSFCNQNPGAC